MVIRNAKEVLNTKAQDINRKAPKFKTQAVLAIVKLILILNRAYQRMYVFERKLVESLLSSIFSSLEMLMFDFDDKEQSFENLGQIGLKKVKNKNSNHTVPEGQHRMVILDLFCLFLLKQARLTGNEELEEILRKLLFTKGIVSKENFKIKILNDKIGDDQILMETISRYCQFILSDETNFKEYVIKLGKTFTVYMYSEGKKIKRSEPAIKVSYVQTLYAFEEIVDNYYDSLNNKIIMNGGNRIEKKDFIELLFKSLECTFFNVAYLRKHDSEAKYYANSCAPKREQEENDRVRIVCLTQNAEDSEKYNKIINLIDKFESKTKTLFDSKSELFKTAIYKSSLMNLVKLNDYYSSGFVSSKPGLINSISTVLDRKIKLGLIDPLSFYEECNKQLDMLDSILLKETTSDLILSNLVKGLKDSILRVLPIIMNVKTLTINHEETVKSNLEINMLFMIISNYNFSRQVIHGGNTEKEADKFFANLFYSVKAENNLRDINLLIENKMRDRGFLAPREDFDLKFISKFSISKNYNYMFLLFFNLSLFLSRNSNRNITAILSGVKTIHSFAASQNIEIEHFIPKKKNKMINSMKEGENLELISSYIKNHSNTLINLHFLDTDNNGDFNNDIPDDKLNTIRNSNGVNIPNSLEYISQMDLKGDFCTFEGLVSNFEMIHSKFKEILMNFMFFQEYEYSSKRSMRIHIDR